MAPPDPSVQVKALCKTVEKMISDKEEVKYRYYGFMVGKNLSSGAVSQAQVDELWRYLSAESREFAVTQDKPDESDDTKKVKNANVREIVSTIEAKVAAALVAKGGKGDPKGGKGDPQAGKGGPTGGQPSGNTPGGKGGGKNDAAKVELCKYFDSDNGCRFGA